MNTAFFFGSAKVDTQSSQRNFCFFFYTLSRVPSRALKDPPVFPAVPVSPWPWLAAPATNTEQSALYTRSARTPPNTNKPSTTLAKRSITSTARCSELTPRSTRNPPESNFARTIEQVRQDYCASPICRRERSNFAIVMHVRPRRSGVAYLARKGGFGGALVG